MSNDDCARQRQEQITCFGDVSFRLSFQLSSPLLPSLSSLEGEGCFVPSISSFVIMAERRRSDAGQLLISTTNNTTTLTNNNVSNSTNSTSTTINTTTTTINTTGVIVTTRLEHLPTTFTAASTTTLLLILLLTTASTVAAKIFSFFCFHSSLLRNYQSQRCVQLLFFIDHHILNKYTLTYLLEISIVVHNSQALSRIYGKGI